MRIVIDLQGAQSESRFRGIGRYSLALALGIARNAGEHEVWLVLGSALGAAIEDIRTAFASLVPRERIQVFDTLTPSEEREQENTPRTRASELLREYFIAQLSPDVVVVTSLFEGFIDNAVVSVGQFAADMTTAVVLYDLIPLINPQTYLQTEQQRSYYERKIGSLKRADLLLAISDFSRAEALVALDLDPERVVAISTAVEPVFAPASSSAEELQTLRSRFGLRGEFIMYAPGGFDNRKNIDGLITAFSLLESPLSQRFQLLVVSKINDHERSVLEELAQRNGLASDRLIITGYVDDAHLIALYRACALFVFPSKHEGFGLPALEAMSCGAPVIGSDTTSVPEVVGWGEALFDPHNPAAMAAKITQVLSDPDMLQSLREHSARQATRFSWDGCAQRALRALEDCVAARASAPLQTTPRPKIAFVSPLPPERTGVADYAVRILPTLLPYFEIDLITHAVDVSLPVELSGLAVHDPSWLHTHANEYDHIVYQFGNSPFHSYMLPLLARHPGVVVLHDFFLSSMLSYEEMTGAMPGVWSRALFDSHGYTALRTRLTPAGWELAKHAYPSNLNILRDATHVIVHSDYARTLAQQWYGREAGRTWSQAQLPRAVPIVNDRAGARQDLGIRDDAFVVCNFGFVAPTKHCLELVQAWIAAGLNADPTCELVFVGANDGGHFGKLMLDAIQTANAGNRIRISGWISDDDYLRYLQAADAGVQLRTGSRGETSGTVLDCMVYGLATIINANGAMAEFPHDATWMLPDVFTQQQLVDALHTLRTDPVARSAYGQAALALMKRRNSPERCGAMYRHALLRDRSNRSIDRHALYDPLLNTAPVDAPLEQWATSISRSPENIRLRQLLVDVTAIAQHDLKTGIERVVRTQLQKLLEHSDAGYRVEPVYFAYENGLMRCRYARNYATSLLGLEGVCEAGDLPVEVAAGDVYYSADHSPHAMLAAAEQGVFAHWRQRGVEVNFLLYDLLPVLRPEFFPPDAGLMHAAWMAGMVREGDRIMCISRTVADELAEWTANNQQTSRQLSIGVLHLGADIAGPVPERDTNDPHILAIAAKPSFVMVGTLEPRKGHLQTLDAFEALWAAGVDVNLVIIGSEGWKPLADADRRTIPEIMARLTTHEELGKRLIWMSGIDDAMLQQVYLASACLLAPSEGEGFGLPLFEAARYDLPVLARDIPVFREVCGNRALYFSGLDGTALAQAVRSWMACKGSGTLPVTAQLNWQTWDDNVNRLLDTLDGKVAPAYLMPRY
jgi:glycosyltransferase involved in cell wall biosynthesis